MPNLIKFLFHLATWEKLPLLPRTYSSDYEPDEADRDVQALMKLSRVRCPQGARVLEKKHQTTTRQLAREMKIRKRRRRPLTRAMNAVRRSLGLTSYDPMRSIRRKHERRKR